MFSFDLFRTHKLFEHFRVLAAQMDERIDLPLTKHMSDFTQILTELQWANNCDVKHRNGNSYVALRSTVSCIILESTRNSHYYRRQSVCQAIQAQLSHTHFLSRLHCHQETRKIIRISQNRQVVVSRVLQITVPWLDVGLRLDFVICFHSNFLCLRSNWTFVVFFFIPCSVSNCLFEGRTV